MLFGIAKTIKQRFSLTSFDSGTFVFPGLQILERVDGLDSFKYHNTPPMELRFTTIEVDTAEAIKDISNKIEAIVGHSLGGAKAKIIGLPNAIKTYTFNTAFAHSRWLKNAITESVDFVKTGDVLTYLQTESLFKKLFPKQLGQTIKYDEAIWDMLPKYNLRARIVKFVYGLRRHGIN